MLAMGFAPAPPPSLRSPRWRERGGGEGAHWNMWFLRDFSLSPTPLPQVGEGTDPQQRIPLATQPRFKGVNSGEKVCGRGFSYKWERGLNCVAQKS